MCVGVLSACIILYKVHAVPTEARRGYLGSLKIELQTVVSYHVNAGN